MEYNYPMLGYGMSQAETHMFLQCKFVVEYPALSISNKMETMVFTPLELLGGLILTCCF